MWPKGKSIEDAVSIGEEEGGLYKLKGHSEITLVHETTSQSELWHKRIPHINYKALPHKRKVMTGLPNLKIDHEGICKRKEYQESISEERNKSKRYVGIDSFRCVWSNVFHILEWL